MQNVYEHRQLCLVAKIERRPHREARGVVEQDHGDNHVGSLGSHLQIPLLDGV